MACILLWSSAVRVQDSRRQTYRNTFQGLEHAGIQKRPSMTREARHAEALFKNLWKGAYRNIDLRLVQTYRNKYSPRTRENRSTLQGLAKADIQKYPSRTGRRQTQKRSSRISEGMTYKALFKDSWRYSETLFQNARRQYTGTLFQNARRQYAGTLFQEARREYTGTLFKDSCRHTDTFIKDLSGRGIHINVDLTWLD